MAVFSFSIGSKMLRIFVSCLALVLFCSNKLANADLIDDVCPTTAIDPSYCQKALRSDPRSRTANLPTLGRIAIDLAQSDTKSAITLVKSLMKKATDPKLKVRYESCLENYDESSYNLKGCISSLKNKDYETLNIRASAALDGPVTCDENFSGPPPESDQLKRSGKKVKELCSAICTIANKLGANYTNTYIKEK